MNIMSMDIILIFVFAVIGAGLVKGTCPSNCSCIHDSSGSHVNCHSKYLGRKPALPKDTYYLDLQYNNITGMNVQLCKEMPQLQTIYISHNLIIEIPENTFVDCEQLYSINLYYNKIRSIESNTFVNMTNLYQLYLYNNNISTIKSFTFMNLPSLRYLHLYNNKIRSLVSYTFINLTNLYELDIFNNEISTIEPFTFVDLPSLRYLYMYNNKIRSLESNTFINMTSLYELKLQNNAISTIEAFTFMNLPSLHRLYLHGNNISDIEEHAFGNLTSLTLLGLSGNPLNCDCSIFAFWTWLIERSSIYNIGNSARCSNGTLVKSLQSAVLDTCHPDNCQCYNGGKCVAMGYELICDCLGQWTVTFSQDSRCTSYCGFGDCYIQSVNGTAQCLCADRYVNYCPDKLCFKIQTKCPETLEGIYTSFFLRKETEFI